MLAVFLHRTCKTVLQAGFVNSADDLALDMDELRGSACACGETVDEAVVLFDKDDRERQLSDSGTWNKPPKPRMTGTIAQNFRRNDARLARKLAARPGTRNSEHFEKIRRSVVALAPGDLQAKLDLIPVLMQDTYEPNAICKTFPNCSVPVVLFHHGLGSFLFYMNRALLSSYGFTSLQTMANLKDQHRRGVDLSSTNRIIKNTTSSADYDRSEAFVVTALSFLGRTTQEISLPPLDDLYRINEMYLTESMERFLLAHEFGHFLLGHQVSRPSLWQRLVRNGRVAERSRAMELEADQWAQDAVCGAFSALPEENEVGASLDMLGRYKHFAAPAIAFLYFDFMRFVGSHLRANRSATDAQSSALAALAKKSRSTHPNDKDRVSALMKYAFQYGNWRHAELVQLVEDDLEKVKSEVPEILRRLNFDLVNRPPQARRSNSQLSQETLREILNDVAGNSLRRAEAVSLSNQAREQFQDGRSAEAKQSLLDAADVAIRPEDKASHLAVLAALCASENDVDGVLHCVRAAIELSASVDIPSNDGRPIAAAALKVSPDLRKRGDSASAFMCYQFAFEQKDPDLSSIAALKWGAMLEGEGRRERAKELFEYAYRSRNANAVAEAAMQLGTQLITGPNTGSDLNRACRFFREALSGESGDETTIAYATYNLGIAFKLQGKLDRAEAQFRATLTTSNQRVVQAARLELRKLSGR